MALTMLLYTGLGVGHLNPMVELAKLLLARGLNVVIALTEPQQKRAAFTAAVAAAAAANPDISFHTLPPPADLTVDSNAHPLVRHIDILRAYNAPLREYLRSLTSVAAVVLDFFFVDALDVAAELDVPAYFLYAASACSLAVLLHLQFMQAKLRRPFQELSGDELLHFPGAPPLPASHLLDVLFLEDRAPGELLVHVFNRILEANGILMNTFEWLEPDAVRALNDGSCVPGRAMPPAYCIGPMVGTGGGSAAGERHECLSWLDEQPEKSVVFLCFGSMASFSAKQITEIAVGLESSGRRFLWVLRSPVPDPTKMLDPLPPPDPDAILPEGFLARTAARGFIVKSWAPQVEILRHRATGAFVTHCGWNSTLEGVAAGLPLLCWPLYAEQRMNKVFLVERAKLGVELEGYDKGIVRADGVAEKVKWVMETEGGDELRRRASAAKAAAEAAVKEGGESAAAVDRFLMELAQAGSTDA